MAGQAVDGGTKATGTYASIYGAMDLYTGKSVTTTAPVTEPSDELDLSNLSDEDKAALVAQIKTDAASIDFAASATDTYFGGKMLYRAANLMTLAEQLGVTDVAATLRTGLTAELKKWFDPKGCDTSATKCFVYDDGHQVDDRAGGLLRLGRAQRPPLPLRLHAVRRRGLSPRTTRPWPTSSPRSPTCWSPTSHPRRPPRTSRSTATSTRTRVTRGPPAPLRSRTGTTRSPAARRSTPGTGWPCGRRSAATRTCTTRRSG